MRARSRVCGVCKRVFARGVVQYVLGGPLAAGGATERTTHHRDDDHLCARRARRGSCVRGANVRIDETHTRAAARATAYCHLPIRSQL